MIGTQENAAAAYWGDLPYLAHGTARTVYIKDNVVYKVDIVNGSNGYELANLIRLQNATLPEHVAIPKWHAYDVNNNVIIAMEYIDGLECGDCLCGIVGTKCDCNDVIPEDISDSIVELGVTDPGFGNVIMKDDTFYLIDVEC